MKKLIDRYITKHFSGRLFYGHGRKYKLTKFQPGSKYIVDVKDNKMIILPAEEGKVVSKRYINDEVIPVIDVKTLKDKDKLKKLQQAFSDASKIQISIYEDEIIVEAYTEEIPSKSELKASSIKSKNVKSITDFLNVKKKATVVVPKKTLLKVVGQYDSFSPSTLIDVVKTETLQSTRLENVISITKSLEQIHIPLKVISLFSGAGLLDYGFIKSGFDIVFALEKDSHACKTYRHNIGDHIVQEDITKFDKTLFPKDAPIVIGGPPCQGFSNANRKTNFLDNPNNLLVRKFIEVVKVVNAQVFVIENVPQILTAGNGQFKEEIYNALSDYEIESGVLNAIDYGSAQSRKRAIFIGSRIGRIPLPKPLKKVAKTVRDAFKGLTSAIANQLDITFPKGMTLERIKHVPKGGNIFDIPKEIRPKGCHSNAYRRLEWDKPSITIANPRKSNILHPEENRILSIRECARLMDLPDEFEFKGSLSAMQQQVANGVPSMSIAYHVAKVIKEHILKHNLRKAKDKRSFVTFVTC
ncbi:DNA cytosine methyltransferase [Calidifontibacillus erzurumensis]|uniref:DNA cytosine methyltransferase n=1 Tax=Calidifontibacillus erzurumensis TaxID=2741433 RepID=UPI0035B54AD3